MTNEIIAAHAGSPVVCLDARAIDRVYRLHAERPGIETNERLRADVIGSDGTSLDVTVEGDEPVCTVVTVCGPIEQRAGWHDPCSGWSDGHDAIAERMCAALAEGDVVMVIDSPGGAHAGLQEGIRRVVAAKERYGRTVTAFADEMIGSAAYWWAAVVADEIYLPEAAVVGSIGARSAHVSCAEHLRGEGIDTTYFAWPGPGKVAFAPELPLSDLGKERGERDVAIAGEAFCAAVVAARGISRDDIVALEADALTGQTAVDAGLADGVATLEDVLQYALALTSERIDMTSERMSSTVSDPQERTMSISAGMKYEKKTLERYEEDDEDDDAPPSEPGEEEEDKGGKADEDDKAEAKRADDEPPPSSKPAPPAPPAPKKKNTPPPPKRAAESLAAIFGLRDGASTLAVKTAAIAMRTAVDRLFDVTQTATLDDLVGAVMAISEDAKRTSKIEADNRELRRRADARERNDLLRKLSAANVHPRGDLFVDEIDEVSGKRSSHPAPVWAEMKLATLRGYVSQKLATAPQRTNPFEPDRALAEGNASAAKAKYDATNDQQIQRMAARTGMSAEQLAASRNALLAAGVDQ